MSACASLEPSFKRDSMNCVELGPGRAPVSEASKPVAIIMGSQSDWAVMRRAAETLEALGVGYDARIVSAHRTPDRLVAFAKGAKAAGFKVVIAGAGGAAHLPGMTAAMTIASRVRRAGPVEGAVGSGQPVCRSCRCRRAFRLERWRSAKRARSTPRCSPLPFWR